MTIPTLVDLHLVTVPGLFFCFSARVRSVLHPVQKTEAALLANASLTFEPSPQGVLRVYFYLKHKVSRVVQQQKHAS